MVQASKSSDPPAVRNRRRLSTALLPLTLERDADLPLQRQLFDQLRESILTGRLAPGTRLPSTRSLAEELNCSRNTAISAYDQLFAEGYLEGESGSGTYVSSVLPEELLRARPAMPGPARAPGESQLPAARGRLLAGVRRDKRPAVAAFSPGWPETASFPFDVWSRLLARHWRQPDVALPQHGDPLGYPPLRAAIAEYLRAARGLDCGADQVIVTSGGQQCIHLTVMALTDPGERVWIEDPGYTGLRGPLLAAGLEALPVPVDKEGFDLARALKGPAARLAIVTPSHQYPLGVVMTLARRLELLKWASTSDGYILEDDYDSEYRYAGRPLSALQGLDRAGRVLYAGSFSKVLFPSLRLAYLVVPPDLVPATARLRRAIDDHPSSVAQPVLADFFSEGYFAAHVRRLRRLYAQRQKALLEAAARHLDGLLELAPDEAGMHLVARLASPLAARMDDRQAATRAAAAGLNTPPLSGFHLDPEASSCRQGLLLGYAALPEAAVEEKVRQLAAALSA